MRRSARLLKMLATQESAGALIDERRFTEARDLLLEVEAQARQEKIDSGHLHWLLAYAFDGTGDETTALVELEKALALDPLNHTFHETFRAFADGLRRELADPKIREDDPATPVRYELLLRCEAADANAHLAMARYCARTGAGERALKLLESVTSLDPFNHEAWALLESVALARGEEQLARRARVEAEATSVLSAAASGVACVPAAQA